MRPRVFRPGALGLALLSGPALAAGFGEIALLSRIGEPLRAEVDIVSSGKETIETACFSLAPIRESDLPVVTSARLQLIKDGQNYRLTITGKPIAEPVFMLALRAGCGVELQRDFVLMPQAPIAPPISPALQPASTIADNSATPVPGRRWRAGEGDTLESLAESLVPNDLIKQRRMLVALRRANPGLESSEPLAQGTEVRIPELRKQAISEPRHRSESGATLRPNRSNADRAEATPPEPQATPAKPKAPARAPDRLVLSAAPDDLKPGEKASPPRGPLPEMEERMAKMEATLHLLNEEITKLNQALTLTTEALEVQQKLQAAQAAVQQQQQTKVVEKEPAPLAVPAPAGAPHPTDDNWIELLLSAVAGGIISAVGAHLLVLRRKNRLEDELPLAVQAVRPHSAAESVHPVAVPMLAPEVQIKEPAALPTDPRQELANFEVTETDSYSLLKLAEIMLSFGRIHDAAETLAQYIKEASPNQVQPWTMLLDLYRRGNMPKEFGILAVRIRERFNIHVPTWDEAKAPDNELHTLESYPHIVSYLGQAWGCQECMDFLQDLVTDNRSGHRAGFPLEVVEEIVLLMRVLEDGYGLKRA